MASAAHETAAGSLLGPEPANAETRAPRSASILVFGLSFAFALVFWEAVSASGLIREQDLPSMTATMGELWRLVQTGDFWAAFLQTARGWAIGLGLATLLAVPVGIGVAFESLVQPVAEQRLFFFAPNLTRLIGGGAG